MMHKKVCLGLVGLLVMLLMGGAWAFAAVSGEALAYFPVGKPGNKWEYDLTIGEQNAGKLIYGVVKPEGDNMLVGIAFNGKIRSVVCYQESERGLMRVKDASGNVITNYSPAQLVLPAKMEAGKKWDWTSEDGKMKEADAIIQPQGKITVPAGSFDSIMVSCEGVDANGVSYSDKSWYVKGIGMVREEYKYDGKLTVLKLNRYQVN